MRDSSVYVLLLYTVYVLWRLYSRTYLIHCVSSVIGSPGTTMLRFDIEILPFPVRCLFAGRSSESSESRDIPPSSSSSEERSACCIVMRSSLSGIGGKIVSAMLVSLLTGSCSETLHSTLVLSLPTASSSLKIWSEGSQHAPNQIIGLIVFDGGLSACDQILALRSWPRRPRGVFRCCCSCT